MASFTLYTLIHIFYVSADNGEQVEAMYIRKRFQGLSLEDQRRMKQKRKKKFLYRRKSSATTSTSRSSAAVESQARRSTSQISARTLPQANLFGLQVKFTRTIMWCMADHYYIIA